VSAARGKIGDRTDNILSTDCLLGTDDIGTDRLRYMGWHDTYGGRRYMAPTA